MSLLMQSLTRGERGINTKHNSLILSELITNSHPPTHPPSDASTPSSPERLQRTMPTNSVLTWLEF